MAASRDYAPTTLGPVVLRYLGDRRRRGEVTALTVRGLRNHLMSFAESYGRRPLAQLGPRAVERWLEDMERAKLAPATRAGRLSSLRGFARWCVLHRIVDRDWTLAVPKVRRPRAMSRDMTGDHVAAMLAVAQTPRETLLVWLMYGCGLRCVEVSRLDLLDVDRTTRLLYLTGKGGHQRAVPMPPMLVSAIDTYLGQAGHAGGQLIRSEDGLARPLSPNRISHIMRRLVADAGLKVYPYDGRSAHGLRAAAASDVYDVSKDPAMVAEFLGHVGLSNLQHYMRRRRLEELAEVQGARSYTRPAASAP